MITFALLNLIFSLLFQPLILTELPIHAAIYDIRIAQLNE